MEIFGHRHIVNLKAEGKRVDKHTHGIGNFQVGAAAADSAQIDLAVVSVARYHITRGSEEQMGRRDFLLAAEGCGLFVVGGADGLADESLVVGVGQVGRNLAGTLTSLQLLGKELLGSLEGLALLSLLLVAYEVEIGVGLFLNGLPFESSAYLTNQQVGRTAVEHQMMNVHQQVDGVVGLHDFKAVERSLLQIERSYELVLVFIQFFLLHHAEGYLHGNAALGGLHDGVALGGEVNAELGMLAYHLLYALGQSVGIGTGGVGEQIGDVVDGRSGILQTLEVNTRLGIRQRHGFK